MTIESFRVAVPDRVLEELRDRLGRSRFARQASDSAGRAAGAGPGICRELVTHWRDSWRCCLPPGC